MTGMQPQNLENLGGQEQLPVPQPQAGERVPVLPTPEAGIQTGAERREQTAEAQAAASDAAMTTPVATPVVAPQQGDVNQTTSSGLSGAPMVAADEDVIEKEWVDKSKQIILETKDDPFTRSNKVSELQRDYLKKRYGKDLGASA